MLPDAWEERFARIGVFSAAVRPDQIPDYEDTETGNAILHEDLRQGIVSDSFFEENAQRCGRPQ